MAPVACFWDSRAVFPERPSHPESMPNQRGQYAVAVPIARSPYFVREPGKDATPRSLVVIVSVPDVPPECDQNK